jgi:hypothetical protein
VGRLVKMASSKDESESSKDESDGVRMAASSFVGSYKRALYTARLQWNLAGSGIKYMKQNGPSTFKDSLVSLLRLEFCHCHWVVGCSSIACTQ